MPRPPDWQVGGLCFGKLSVSEPLCLCTMLGDQPSRHCCAWTACAVRRSTRCKECNQDVPGAAAKKGKRQQQQQKKQEHLEQHKFYAGKGDKPELVTTKAGQNYRNRLAAMTSCNCVSSYGVGCLRLACIGCPATHLTLAVQLWLSHD